MPTRSRRTATLKAPAPEAGSGAGDMVLGVGGRLAAPPAAALVDTAFAAELASQADLRVDIGLADLADTIALIEAEAIPAKDGAALLAALLQLQRQAAALPLDPALGDLYTNREHWLSQRTPAAGWLGAGRARREAITTAYHLAMRARLLGLAGALTDAGAALARAAETHRDALMPDYTYLQAAQPTTFGHYLLGFAFPLLRDLDRLRALHGRVNLSPAGCGSSNGSVVPRDRQRLAELLGFDGVVAHARDAMWQADGPIETLGVVAGALVNLDRLAEDLMIFASAEFGFVGTPDAYARSSKVMPQKRNPFALSYVRGLANKAIGLQTMMAVSGRTPSGQMDNRLFVYGESLAAVADAAGAFALMSGVLGDLVFHAGAAHAALQSSPAMAADLAVAMMTAAGIDYRAAHRVVGKLVQNLHAEGRTLNRLTESDLGAAAAAVLGGRIRVPWPAVQAALDPRQAVQARRGIGAAGAEPLAAAIAQCRKSLGESAAWRQQAAARSAKAERALLARAAKLAGVA
jgi:argininosuccinate lyase